MVILGSILIVFVLILPNGLAGLLARQARSPTAVAAKAAR